MACESLAGVTGWYGRDGKRIACHRLADCREPTGVTPNTPVSNARTHSASATIQPLIS